MNGIWIVESPDREVRAPRATSAVRDREFFIFTKIIVHLRLFITEV